MKLIKVGLLISTVVLFTACDTGGGDDDVPTINVTTPSGQTVDAGPLTEKTDIWIVKNVNQAEIDRLTALAPRLDPDAITLVADMSCTELRSSYSLLSGPETLSSGYEALTYYFQNDGFSDNNFYCKEYSLPSDAANYGNLTIGIASWNNNIDQSDHHTLISGS